MPASGSGLVAQGRSQCWGCYVGDIDKGQRLGLIPNADLRRRTIVCGQGVPLLAAFRLDYTQIFEKSPLRLYRLKGVP